MADRLSRFSVGLPVVRIKVSELYEIAAEEKDIIDQKGSKMNVNVGKSTDGPSERSKSDTGTKISRKKRPDQAIYIPKPKLASLNPKQDGTDNKTVTDVCVSLPASDKTAIKTELEVADEKETVTDYLRVKTDVHELKNEVLDAKSEVSGVVFEPENFTGTIEFTNSRLEQRLLPAVDVDVDPSNNYVVWNSDFGRSDGKVDEKQTIVVERKDSLKGKGRGRFVNRNSDSKECKLSSSSRVLPSNASPLSVTDGQFRSDTDPIHLDDEVKRRESDDRNNRFELQGTVLDWSVEVEALERQEAAASAAAAAVAATKPVSHAEVDKTGSENRLCRSLRAEREISAKKASSVSSKQLKKRDKRQTTKKPEKSHRNSLSPSKPAVKVHSENRKRTTTLTEKSPPHGKGSGGIIHLPNFDASEPVEQTCSPILEREIGRKQLYDPERPLCIVSPGNHVSQHQSNAHSGVTRDVLGAPSTSSFPLNHNEWASIDYPSFPPPRFATEYGFNPMNSIHPRDQMFFERMQSGLTYGLGLTATEKNIREAMLLEIELNTLIDQPFSATDSTRLSQIRWKIQLRYENTILSDLEFCSKQSIEQILWKAAYYQVIEWLRRQLAEETAAEVKVEIRQSLIRLIEEGVVFFETLLDKLQETYGFNLNDFYDSDALQPQTLSRRVKLALVSAQRITLCLGDLARYREQVNDGWNYGRARSWYLKAQQLVPKNGRPYNQLAILAVYARRKLDAVYYFMRSLAASNPFLTARESLLSIFHDAQKKYLHEQTEKIGNDGKVEVRSRPRRRSSGLGTNRIEIWYSPDGHMSKSGGGTNGSSDTLGIHSDGTDEDENEDEIRNLSAIELHKKFTLSFLHVHNKLYNKVGMDSFGELCKKMLREFRLLLAMQQSALDSQRLIQIIAINMFVIHDTVSKDEAHVGSNCESVAHGRAVEVSVEMFRLMVERCVYLLGLEKDGSGNCDRTSVLPEELQKLLPAIKVWCDWLMCNPTTWNPLPSLTDLGIGPEKKDVWTQLSAFLSLLKAGDFQCCTLVKEVHDGCEPVILPEDTTLAGFIPLITSAQETVYAVPPINKEMARNVFRIQRILLCGEFLCGMNPPVLGYSITGDYVPVAHSPVEERKTEKRHSVEKEPAEVVRDVLEEVTEDWNDSWSEDDTCRHSLRSIKQHLEREKANREKQLRQNQDVLRKVSQPLNVQFEVRPTYIVPDTNCFIDHLPRIKSLVAFGKFTVVVPLIVINELDGLALGFRNSGIVDQPSKSHGLQVSEEARRALDYLEEQFSVRNVHVKAITAKGNIMDTITFRSEANNDKLGTNDDIILLCCLKFVDNSKDDVHCIRRRVVLLTDDRNLRVKAHAHEVPVKDIPRFMTLMHVA